MKSPFPGMDPYLEAHWGDVHTRLIVYGSDQLRPQLPSNLRIRVEEHVAVDSLDADQHGFYPDIRVLERPRERSEPGGVATDVAIAEPLVVPIDLELETQRSIQIIDSHSGNRVVTAIEILSPANKATEKGRNAYRRKQKDLLEGEVNLVEIDLLRDGEYVVAVPRDLLPIEYTVPYRVCVTRNGSRIRGEVYRISLRERLPKFRIPLRDTDQDALLDLQEVIDKAYENGGYEDINYRNGAIPPLRGDDDIWADKLLREQGRR